MKVLNYDFENFYHYFRGAWIKNPLNPEQTLQVAANGRSSEGKNLIVLSDGVSPPVEVPFEEFSWEHLTIPSKLGYRNLRGFVYYCTMKVQRITSKGLSDRTAAVLTIPQIDYLCGLMGAVTRNMYAHGCSLSRDMVRAILKPEYPTLKECVKELTDTSCLGQALSRDVALCVSDQADTNFLLLFNNAVAASSNDGERWKVLSPELIDPVTRSIGKLNYV